MRICYLLLVHHRFPQAVRLMDRLAAPGTRFVVHIDAGADRLAVGRFRREAARLRPLYAPRVRARWGSYSQALAIMRCIQTALQGPPCERYCLLSGQDYPIAPNEVIADFFTHHCGREYLEVFPLDLSDAEAPGWSPYFRFRRYHVWVGKHRRTLPWLQRGMPPLPICHGSTWWALTRPALQYVAEQFAANRSLRRYLRTGFLADEVLVPTILASSPFPGSLTGTNVTYARWTPTSGPHPCVLTATDLNDALASGKLFARKFDTRIDARVLDELDSRHAGVPERIAQSARQLEPALTLVICTHNRAGQLERCLQSLNAIRSARPWELVIVDNASTDTTPSVIERFRANARFPISAVFEPRPGLGRARNRGWRSARGDIVAFIDDDCYPDGAFVDRVLSVFDANQSLGFLGGRIALYDPSDYPITIQEYPERINLPPRCCVPPGLIQGANLSVRRAALEASGGVDERFGAGTRFPCEDVDLSARISAVGWSGAYDPGPLVYHHHGRRSALEASRLMRQYDRGRGAYYAKCLINPAICASTVRHWGHRILEQPLSTTAREWLAAAEYWLRACAAFPGRWLRWGHPLATWK